MMLYRKRDWVEGTGTAGNPGEFLFSAAREFRLSSEPRRRLGVGVADLGASGGSLLSVTSSGHEIAVDGDDFTTIMMPVAGTVEVQCGRRDYTMTGGQALTFLPSARRTRVARPDTGDFEALLVKAPMPVLNRLFHHADPLLSGARDAPVLVGNRPPDALADLVRYALRDLASEHPVLSTPSAAASLEVLVWEHVRSLLESGVGGLSARTPASTRKVWQAVDFMRANFADALRLKDIAMAVGVGQRSLQLAFRQVTGSTPWQALTTIRLESARLRLITAGPGDTVTTIALDCGFTHLGRFARLYRETYGEPPASTLRRRG